MRDDGAVELLVDLTAKGVVGPFFEADRTGAADEVAKVVVGEGRDVTVGVGVLSGAAKEVGLDGNGAPLPGQAI